MAVPHQMTAIEIAAFGGPEVLKPVTRPVPSPGDGEVLIRVHAAGVNRPDVMQRQGKYPPPAGASDLPGLEIAGEVAALGRGVAGLAVGDKVCALLPGGGYAEYATAAEPLCLPIPGGMDMAHAGAIPETYFTVWTNLFDRARLEPGQTALIHGGTSGIGTTAIQLAVAWGAKVYATAGSDDKARACERLGALRGINYRSEDFVAVMKAATEGRGVDAILDMVAGSYTPRNIEAAALDGHIAVIALLGGSKAEINLGLLLTKRLTITGSTLRARTVAQKKRVADAVRTHLWPILESGRAHPVVHATFPLAHAAEAHRLMESSNHIGKIVLTP